MSLVHLLPKPHLRVPGTGVWCCASQVPRGQPAWENCPLNVFCHENCLVGPGIAPTVKTGEEVGFVVDAKSAGKGKVTCTVLTPDGTEAEADVVENEDGTYDIFYTAAKPGTYVIYVRFGGVDIPNSPFTVMVSQLYSENTSHSDSCCHVLFSNRLTLYVNGFLGIYYTSRS